MDYLISNACILVAIKDILMKFSGYICMYINKIYTNFDEEILDIDLMVDV
jgi:hypothetical protein